MTFDFSLYFQVLFLIFFIGNWLIPHNFIFVSMGNACKNVPPGSIGGDISFLKNKSQKYVFEIDPNHVNPYGSTTNPEDEQEMTREVHYQSHLKNQGINQDFIMHPEFYQACLLCNGQYGSNLKAIVLECGHFLCQMCLKRTDKCFVYTCLKPINSAKNRQFVFNKQQVLGPAYPKNKVRQYDITINVSQDTHAGTIEQKVKGTQKFSQIIQKNINIRNVFKNNPNAALLIKTKQKDYNSIKNMTFDQLAEKFNLQPIQSGKTNMIKYYNLAKGGQN